MQLRVPVFFGSSVLVHCAYLAPLDFQILNSAFTHGKGIYGGMNGGIRFGTTQSQQNFLSQDMLISKSSLVPPVPVFQIAVIALTYLSYFPNVFFTLLITSSTEISLERCLNSSSLHHLLTFLLICSLISSMFSILDLKAEKELRINSC